MNGAREIRLRLALAALVAAAGLVLPAGAQDDSERIVDPRDSGLDLLPGVVRKATGETVATTDSDGKPVIGRLHVRIGDGAVVLLPDGQLVGRTSDRFMPTDRPFVPIKKGDLAERLTGDFPGFKTKQTNHYLYVYDASEEFVHAASRILESMLAGMKGHAEAQKIAVSDPEVPLVVVMFRTEQDFQRHRRMPDGVVAYYHTLSNRVFMYEQSRLAQVRPDLAIQQSIATIAHEGAHQILHNIGVQQRLSGWPMWLSEGLAEYFAPTSTGTRLKWKGAGQVNDLRMFELEQYVKSRASEEPDGRMVEQTVVAARLSSTGYASAWALTHYLAKNRRTEFNQYVREVSRYGPFEGAGGAVSSGIVRGNLDLFVKHFGEDQVDMEKRLVLHLKKQPYTDPFSDSPHFVATLVTSNGRRPQRLVNTFHSPSLAEKWLRETLDKVPEAERSRAERSVRVFPNRAAAETFAQQWRRGK